MKRYLYIILASLILQSCDTLIDEIKDVETYAEICIIADTNEDYTRVKLEGNTTKWEVGDRITVALYGDDIKYAELEIKSSSDISNNGKRGKFRGEVPTGTYYKVTSFYPNLDVVDGYAILDRKASKNIFMMSDVFYQSPSVLTIKKDQTNELPITFAHMMHKIDFNINYDDDVNFEEISVRFSATSNNNNIEFVRSMEYYFPDLEFNDVSKSTSITVDSKRAAFSTMLFPMEEMKNVVFTFDIFFDGIKKYSIRKPESGSLSTFAMNAGTTTSITLDAFTPAPPECIANCTSSVTAKGVTADVTLKNVSYKIDGAKTDIKTVRLEYTKATGTKQWTSIDIDGSKFNDGSEDITIPANGDKYLLEDTNYAYRVTFIPSDSKYEVITTEEKTFKTTFAEITAEISKPKVNVTDEAVEVVVDDVRAYFDGIHITEYENLVYGVFYTRVDDINWEGYIANYANGSMSITFPIDYFTRGAKYYFTGAVQVGVNQNIINSELISVEIPAESPTPPIGDADTSTIAGDWQLTSWCGAEPSFDVYLSITEDGVVTLYQRMTSRLWETYYSTVEFENGIISGIYTDGVAWGASYNVTMSENTMTWTDTTDSTDVSVYTRCTLPDFTNITRATATSSERFL